MYIPSHLNVTDLDQQVKLIEQYPLGVLFNYNSGKAGLLDYFKSGKPPTESRVDSEMCATHLPFHYVPDAATGGKGKLIAHLAKTNQHAQMLEENPNCLVVFQSVDSYVSPDWYPLKKKTEKFVPTWDFACVHAYGKAKIIRNDEQWLLQTLNSITDQEEGKRPLAMVADDVDGKEDSVSRDEDSPRRWEVSQTNKDHLDRLLKNIVGIEIEINSIQSKFKFQQEMPPVNVNGVIGGYARELDPAKAEKLADLTREQYPRQL
ncbi:unnamed protein product [Kluyveromyces dobzhanskii CBS 2104]|uniref:WGS project CCBQ000000000 data, contig 00107 n=1 Tax=Kluyveromyces dobzhanskii CBS 2104 TaxID=1427455 RepID=A0A0A8KZF7_9SACH|nr:unnamed protein product [Kluyveromyces dobzhanskii CBS 2104]